MATTQIDTVIRHLRRAVLRQDAAASTDGQLLASFIEQKDEAAFEALVQRHGPMVVGVCRRVVGNHHDAEDAFQATFLVLARKASSVRPRERVANWLHGVALRTAMKAKVMSAKRREREKQVTQMPEPEAAQQDQWRDLASLIDQELYGLPENYRLPILLCDLEGKTIKEAAGQLGWPPGTLAGRLARGRKLLAKRLANRGVVLSAGSLAAVVSQNAASAGVPTSLMSSTVKAATMIAAGQATVVGMVPAKIAILTEGVMKSMMLTKLRKAVAALVVLGAVVFGGGLLTHRTAAGRQTKSEQNGHKPAIGQSVPLKPDVPKDSKLNTYNNESKEKKPRPSGDNERLQGTWKLVFGSFGDYPDVPGIGLAENLKSTQIVIDGDNWTGWTMQGKKEKTTFRLDATKTPKALDIKDRAGKDALGIYMLGGNDLVICICGGNKQERPTTFVIDRSALSLLIYKRIRNKHQDQARARPTKKDAAQIEIDTWLDKYYQAFGLSRAQVDNPNAEKKDELQGGWILVSCKQDGKAVSKEKQKLWTEGLEQIIFLGKFCTQVRETKEPAKKAHVQMEYTTDPSKDPKRIDLSPPKGQAPEGFEISSLKWIYAVDKDELRIGLCPEASERPTAFAMPKTTLVLTFRRMKQAEIQ